MAKRVTQDLALLGLNVKIAYNARKKVKGVNHHAKAGNINNCLLKSRHATADYVLVLDCDMIVTADFLQTTMPHFFENKNGEMVRKEKAAMLQVPQRFYNLGAEGFQVFNS